MRYFFGLRLHYRRDISRCFVGNQIPWALRDIIANPDVAALFSREFSELREAFDDWHPKTAVLREIRRKLEPIRRLTRSKL